jgi:hypothetical protein
MEKSFPVISVSGNSFQMGYQHGRQAAALIQKHIAWIERFTGTPRAALSAAARFLPAVQKLNRRYIDEVMGLAEGARISFADAMLCQVRSEATRMVDRGCTAFALRKSATADGRTYISRANSGSRARLCGRRCCIEGKAERWPPASNNAHVRLAVGLCRHE